MLQGLAVLQLDSRVGKPLFFETSLYSACPPICSQQRAKACRVAQRVLRQFSEFTDFWAVTFTWPEAEMKKLPSKQVGHEKLRGLRLRGPGVALPGPAPCRELFRKADKACQLLEAEMLSSRQEMKMNKKYRLKGWHLMRGTLRCLCMLQQLQVQKLTDGLRTCCLNISIQRP